jgi:hypothetical protein
MPLATGTAATGRLACQRRLSHSRNIHSTTNAFPRMRLVDTSQACVPATGATAKRLTAVQVLILQRLTVLGQRINILSSYVNSSLTRPVWLIVHRQKFAVICSDWMPRVGAIRRASTSMRFSTPLRLGGASSIQTHKLLCSPTGARDTSFCGGRAVFLIGIRTCFPI